MFNGLGLTKGLSFIKIIGGLSKTLQVANQIIPIYQKAKPAIMNARNMLNVLKEMNKKDNSTKTSETKPIVQNNKNTIEKQTKEKTPVAPTFFL